MTTPHMPHHEDPRLNTLPRMPQPRNQTFSMQVGPPIEHAAGNRIFPNPYNVHPLALFTPTVNRNTVIAARWVNTDNECKASVLVFTDGASPGNGQPNARAGCGVVYNPLLPGMSFPLERSADGLPPTSNRAELRAVVAVLTMRRWPGEGFVRLVIGTDSEYVVKGANEWIEKWKRNGWKTATGAAVKNQDLWRILFEKMEEHEKFGCRVQFFSLKREWNEAADACAKKGALDPDVPDVYTEFMMVEG